MSLLVGLVPIACVFLLFFFSFVCFVSPLSWVGAENLFGECFDIVLHFFFYRKLGIPLHRCDLSVSVSSGCGRLGM